MVAILVLMLLIGSGHASFVGSFSTHRGRPFQTSWSRTAGHKAGGLDKAGTTFFSSANDWNEELGQVIEKQKRAALVEALVCPTGGDSLMDTYLVGRGNLHTTQNDTLACLMLSTSEEQPSPGTAAPTLTLPLSTASASAQLKLLSFAYAGRPISKSVCLTLNSLLVNRDGGLFDNLPWSSWSVDPQMRNRDAAGNVIDAKFHLGKRDAYNRFMGKDWQGRSVSLGNLALRLKYMLEKEEEDVKVSEEPKESLDAWQEDSTASLAKRVLELQIREMEMELAECDYQLAVARMDENQDSVEEVECSRQECQDRLNEMQDKLNSLVQQQPEQDDKQGNDKEVPFYISVLNEIADMTTDSGKNAAPYRGAMGYAPLLDTKEDVEGSLLPYTSPYDLMKEIIEDQLNADVIGAVLENTSLFEGSLVLGGAVILRRRTATKTAKVFGEEISTPDEDEDYGNEGGKGGATFLVECDADEAVGMAVTCKIPIRVESQIWERSNLLTTPVSQKEKSQNVKEAIPLWETLDKEITFVVEGQNRSSTSETSPLRIPKTTTSLFDSLFESSSSSSSSSSMFPTDNPIQSLAEYDTLDNQEKARTLLSLSNFEGNLPRPRVLKEAEYKMVSSSSDKYAQNPLDEMLLPLIDESIRRQYLIRDAEQRGDYELAKSLKDFRSPRQVAKEKAERAREVGEEDVAEWWEDEADLYSDLRADVTQDEGSYSRFLDKDEWYERDRQARAKKLNKSNFGTLLDGIE